MRRMLVAAALLAGVAAAPLQAQSASNLAPRVERLEKEMRAVQRKVFPGGSSQFLEAEIGGQPQAPVQIGTPASNPVADLTARVTALETELQRLTAQTEQNSFKLRQLEEAMGKYRDQIDARMKVLEGGGEPVSASANGAVRPPPVGQPVTPPARLGPERQAALDAVEKPATGDEGEDAYLYGYRLWDAKFYPQAQAQLKMAAEKYPKHERFSYAQNLLGRAYLDDGKPALASVAFYDNYQKMPRGARAPDSLYYLGVALTRLKKPADACKVFDEFDDVYGATASASLAARVTEARADAKCG